MTVAAVSVRYQFAGCELHPDERRLLAGGLSIPLGPHAFDLLVVLVERGGRLVTKDELLAKVWPKVVVEENTLQVHISSLRKALGANAIATVSGRGYRFNLDVAEVSAGRPASPTAGHNLPNSLTSFIGREDVLAELQQLSGRTRLLTLTGAGGCGKTRLAIEFARQRLHGHPDGVWLVELATLADPSLLPQAVAGVLGINEQPGKSFTQTLIEYLASKSLLLVLDNAEHVLAACAQLADAVLRGCAQLVILFTSQERLGIAGELTYRVPSLSVPDPRQDMTPEHVSACESARLFIERARLQRPHFAITAENARALGSICHRLDGIPLAIELAAPRVRSMSAEEVDRRLDQRFGLLTGGSRTALPRHRTLRSMVDWSYDLLSDAEKATLRRMSVFAGGWTLEAAEQVCSDESVNRSEVLDLLTSLADKNLVMAEERDAATRYGLLETVRHYARDQLREIGAEANLQDRHLAYFLALAEEAEPHLKGAEQQVWLGRLEIEHDNLRSALAWSLAAGNAASGLRLAGAVITFWQVHGYYREGRVWLSRLLAAASSGEAATRAKALRAAGILAHNQGDYPVAQAMHEECLAIERRLGDRLGTCRSLHNLGNVAQAQRAYATARALYEEALEIAQEFGHQPSIAFALNNLGILSQMEGDYPSARALFEEALAIQRNLSNRTGVAIALINLGEIACEQGAYQGARPLYEEALAIERELGNKHHIAACLEGFAAVALAMAGAASAARIWGRAERLREEIGVPLTPTERTFYDHQIVTARAAMGDEAVFGSAWQDGRAMNLEHAIQYALAETDKTCGGSSRPEADS